MSLFSECQAALSGDFEIIEGERLCVAIDTFHRYPFHNEGLLWSQMDFTDFELVDERLYELAFGHEDVYVIADDAYAPVFKSNFRLILDNIYDVMALSPKLFIFNNKIMMQPLFPHYTIRVGCMREE
ncbi:CDI toxin immunity protein [Enterobacter sp. WI-ESBL-E8]